MSFQTTIETVVPQLGITNQDIQVNVFTQSITAIVDSRENVVTIQTDDINATVQSPNTTEIVIDQTHINATVEQNSRLLDIQISGAQGPRGPQGLRVVYFQQNGSSVPIEPIDAPADGHYLLYVLNNDLVTPYIWEP